MSVVDHVPGAEEEVDLRRGELLAPGAALVTVAFWASAFVGIRSAGMPFRPARLLGRWPSALPFSASSLHFAASAFRAGGSSRSSASAASFGSPSTTSR